MAKELPVGALPEIRWRWIGHLSLRDLEQVILVRFEPRSSCVIQEKECAVPAVVMKIA